MVRGLRSGSSVLSGSEPCLLLKVSEGRWMSVSVAGVTESSQGHNRWRGTRKREMVRFPGTGLDRVFLFKERGLKTERA